MEFDILASGHGDSVVKCYFRKGIGERARFYTEYLTFVMCRLFKRGTDMKRNEFEYVQNVYSSSYRHGFGTNLNDPSFNECHKMILNALHISVNYNRNYVPSDLNDDIKTKDENHSRGLGIESKWSKQCNPQQATPPNQCPYIDFIMTELRKFSEINYQISDSNSAMFDELLLSLALDHLTHIHSFCLQEKRRVEIKQLIQDTNGPCEHEEHCSILKQFSSRKRETQRHNRRETTHPQQEQLQLDLSSNDTQINMVVDTLSTLHCYLQHKVFDLYREGVGGSSNKFGTIVQHSGKLLEQDADARDDDADEFDVLYTALLHLNELEFNDILDFVSRLHAWCTENQFDFDALIHDVVHRESTKSNLYHSLSSFEQESYFHSIYRAAFNINYEAKDE
eukprot:187116_1